jgi:hypothetical protein
MPDRRLPALAPAAGFGVIGIESKSMAVVVLVGAGVAAGAGAGSGGFCCFKSAIAAARSNPIRFLADRFFATLRFCTTIGPRVAALPDFVDKSEKRSTGAAGVVFVSAAVGVADMNPNPDAGVALSPPVVGAGFGVIKSNPVPLSVAVASGAGAGVDVMNPNPLAAGVVPAPGVPPPPPAPIKSNADAFPALAAGFGVTAIESRSRAAPLDGTAAVPGNGILAGAPFALGRTSKFPNRLPAVLDGAASSPTLLILVRSPDVGKLKNPPLSSSSAGDSGTALFGGNTGGFCTGCCLADFFPKSPLNMVVVLLYKERKVCSRDGS